MLNRPEPHTPFDIRHKEIRDGIADAREREIFDRAVARIDPERLAGICEEHKATIKGPGFAGWGKYLDVCFWIRDKISRAAAFGLMGATPMRVLDLGCGAGHWLAVCVAMGHEAVGLDLAMPMCEEIAQVLGADRRICRVDPRQPLPDLGRFDLVTAFAIKFDSAGRDAEGNLAYWSLDDWDCFLRDVTGNRMRYPGRLHLELNSRVLSSGERVKFSDVLEACRAAGADVREAGSRVEFAVTGPVGLKRPRRSKSRPERARATA